MPALQPVAEIHALRVGQDLDAAGTGSGVHAKPAAPALIAVVLLAVAAHGVLHVLAELIGWILRAHGEVGLGGNGGGTRRLNLRLLIGRSGLRLRLGLLLDLGLFGRRRRSELLHLLHRLFVDQGVR